MCFSSDKYPIKQSVNIILTDFVLTLSELISVKPLWFRSVYLTITIHLCHSFHSVHLVSVSCFCHCYAAVSNFSCSIVSVGFSSAAQWVFLLVDVLSGVFFCRMFSMGFSSAAQWGFLLLQLSGFFFCMMCSVGFSFAAQWVFLLKDVLSGVFF